MSAVGFVSVGEPFDSSPGSASHFLSRTVPGLITSSMNNETNITFELHRDGCIWNHATDCYDYDCYDCTSKCTESATLFETPEVLSNCVTISTIALLTGCDILRIENTTSARNEPALQNMTDLNWKDVINGIQNCQAASCKSELFGSCRTVPKSELCISSGDDVSKNARYILQAVNTLNWLSNPGTDDFGQEYPLPEVAGPGLIAAYITQIALALWLFIWATLVTYWLDLLVALGHRLAQKPREKAYVTATRDRRAADFVELIRSSRLATSVTAHIMDFQEAQCFFVMFFQIAALVKYGDNAWNGGQSLNVAYAVLLSVIHPVPVFMVQSSVQRIGQRWSYPFSLTLIIYLLGFVTDRVIIAKYNLSLLEECGGSSSFLNADLSASFDEKLKLAREAVKHYHYTMILLILDQLADWKRIQNRTMARLRFDILLRPVYCWLWRARWIVSDILMLKILTKYFSILTIRKESKWTYGQVVTVLPWVQLAAKYVTFNVFGVVDVLSKQLGRHYEVRPRAQGRMVSTH